MLTCKQVSNALAEGRYWELPWHRRVGLRMHVAFCAVCHRYNGQVMRMQELAAAFGRREESGEAPPPAGLSDDAKRRLREAIARKGQGDSP